MSKSVLISINPKWCELIATGKKTVEVRKTRPKIETPFKCYIYCTKDIHNALVVGSGKAKSICCTNSYTAIPCGGLIGNGKVIGEFVCDKITDLRDMGGEEFFSTSCMTYEDWRNYTDYTKHIIWGWHISNLVIYDEPKELNEFYKPCTFEDSEKCDNCEKISKIFNCRLSRPPQSWCYMEEI